MKKQNLGKLGERIAQEYLLKKGYKILDLNWQAPFSGKKFGEIDIVAKNKTICFIEVKTIAENPDFFPEDKVDFLKKKKLKKLAEIYLIDKKIPLDAKYQIDVIGIKINPTAKKAKISYFENALGN